MRPSVVVPCALTVAVVLVFPSELTLAVDTGAGQRRPPAMIGPFPPLLSVESESEAPEPAVDGAAMGSAMAPSGREGVGFKVSVVGFVSIS